VRTVARALCVRRRSLPRPERHHRRCRAFGGARIGNLLTSKKVSVIRLEVKRTLSSLAFIHVASRHRQLRIQSVSRELGRRRARRPGSTHEWVTASPRCDCQTIAERAHRLPRCGAARRVRRLCAALEWRKRRIATPNLATARGSVLDRLLRMGLAIGERRRTRMRRSRRAGAPKPRRGDFSRTRARSAAALGCWATSSSGQHRGVGTRDCACARAHCACAASPNAHATPQELVSASWSATCEGAPQTANGGAPLDRMTAAEMTEREST
jgi:hypothetical protein